MLHVQLQTESVRHPRLKWVSAHFLWPQQSTEETVWHIVTDVLTACRDPAIIPSLKPHVTNSWAALGSARALHQTQQTPPGKWLKTSRGRNTFHFFCIFGLHQPLLCRLRYLSCAPDIHASYFFGLWMSLMRFLPPDETASLFFSILTDGENCS